MYLSSPRPFLFGSPCSWLWLHLEAQGRADGLVAGVPVQAPRSSWAERRGRAERRQQRGGGEGGRGGVGLSELAWPSGPSVRQPLPHWQSIFP